MSRKIPWEEKVRRLTARLGRSPELDEILELARGHDMSPEEIEEQRQSWVRGNAPIGDPRWD